MADPTTILEYTTQRNARAEQAVTSTQQRSAAAQSDLAAASAAANNAAGELSDLERKAAEIRQKLSTIVTPADGVELLDALEQTIILTRAKQAAIVKIKNRYSVAQADAAQTQIDLATASAQLRAADAALQQAAQSEADRDALVAALETAPLATIPTEAGKALDETNPVEGEDFKLAQERIADDIPPQLLTRAHDRRARAAGLVTQADKNTKGAEDAVLKERNDNGGLAGAAAKLWIEFQRAEVAARDFAQNAMAAFDRAKSTLAEVKNSARSPLSDEQRERIHDAAMEPDREAAADAEATLDTGVAKDVSDKQALLDDAILKAKAEPTLVNEQAVEAAELALTTAQNAFDSADQLWRQKETLLGVAVAAVDEAKAALAQAIQQAVAAGNDPETDPIVELAKDELTTSEGNLESAEDAYKISDHGRLDLWEAAVPDATWWLFAEYEEAVDILNALNASHPADLKSHLKDTEEAYVAAQLAADKSADVLAQLEAEQSIRAARQASARQAGDARLFSGLRGDE